MCIIERLIGRMMRPFLPVLLDMMGVWEMYPIYPNRLGDYGTYRLPPSLIAYLSRRKRS